MFRIQPAPGMPDRGTWGLILRHGNSGAKAKSMRSGVGSSQQVRNIEA